MNIIQKIRTYGIKGIFNYIVAFNKRRQKKTFFLKNMRMHPCPQPLPGITIVGPLTTNASLSKVLRDFAYSLKDAKIPFQAFNTDSTKSVPDSDIQGILTPKDDFQLLKYSHIIDLMVDPLPVRVPRARWRIVFWEFESGLLSVYPELKSSIGIIGFSDFNAKVFRKALPLSTPVCKVLYPFRQVPIDKSQTLGIRKKYGIDPDDFVVFFNFDFASSANRKNPDGVIKAFAKAFHGIPKTKLVFKTMRAKLFPERMNQLLTLASDLGIADHFICINNYISQQDLYALTDTCDVYISLHRGEGFGLGIAEAMSLGKAVIVTDYSSTTEFCNTNNSIPIPYKLVKVPRAMKDHDFYTDVESWAEPDIEVAAIELQRLFRQPKERQKLGQSAHSFISEHFSIDNFKHSILELLTN